MIAHRLLAGVLLLVCGCSSQPKLKPPPADVEAAVRSRLTAYSTAWFAGDTAGVSNSFVQRNPDEREFATTLGRLAAAQQALLKEQSAVPEDIARTVEMSDKDPMVSLHHPWHFYAAAAAQPPHRMVDKDGAVIVQLIDAGEFTWYVQNIDGKWLIEPYAWAMDRPLINVTDSVRRQLALTQNATVAVRAADWPGLRGVLQQMHQQRMVDRITTSTNLQIP